MQVTHSVYPVGKPLIIAHRGGASEFPENSPAAFEAMRDSGFHYIETDAHASADGVAVLSHDPTLDRTTDTKGPISAYTWRELQRVKGVDGKPAIMRVDDALASFPDIVFNLDAKSEAVVLPLAEAIIRTGAMKRVCVASFSEGRLRRLRNALPLVTSSLGISAILELMFAGLFVSPERLAGRHARTNVAQVPVREYGLHVLTPRFVRTAHDIGLAVQAWTINDVDEGAQLLDMGVDGLITDIPQQMYEELTARGYEIDR